MTQSVAARPHDTLIRALQFLKAGAKSRRQSPMPNLSLPNGRALLAGMTLSPSILRSLAKAPVPVPALRALIGVLVAGLPFDEAFYAATYPDLAAARAAGDIADLHDHFVKHGYLEGRLGTEPEIDEAFYLDLYPDVAAVIARGDIESAMAHYIRAGAAEGRFANARHQEAANVWQRILSR